MVRQSKPTTRAGTKGRSAPATKTPAATRKTPAVARKTTAKTKTNTKTAAKTAPASTKAATPVKAAARVTRQAAVSRTPSQSKQELRDRIDKLERANVNLRAKNRDAVEAARSAADRVDALEEELADLRKAAVAPAEPADVTPVSAPAKAPRKRRAVRAESPDHDPGDAVPPGVAPLEPQPLDAEAIAAKRNLEHLADE